MSLQFGRLTLSQQTESALFNSRHEELVKFPVKICSRSLTPGVCCLWPIVFSVTLFGPRGVNDDLVLISNQHPVVSKTPTLDESHRN